MSAFGPYPVVLDEVATLARVVAGASLARYGDGEFNLCMGHSIPCQYCDTGLRARLRDILQDPGDCLVGIPSMDARSPKARLWGRYRRCSQYLSDIEYVSAFITRPDSAPWIDTPEYWADVRRLWDGRDVTLVRGSVRSMTAEELDGATSVREIVGPVVDAWRDYDRLIGQVASDPLDIVLLCLGPTATVMAVDLCAMGIHAVDVGHIGMFLRKHLNGQPMVVTSADRAAGMDAVGRGFRV